MCGLLQKPCSFLCFFTPLHCSSMHVCEMHLPTNHVLNVFSGKGSMHCASTTCIFTRQNHIVQLSIHVLLTTSLHFDPLLPCRATPGPPAFTPCGLVQLKHACHMSLAHATVCWNLNLNRNHNLLCICSCMYAAHPCGREAVWCTLVNGGHVRDEMRLWELP